MNRIFKVIYSKSKHMYVVTSELAKSHSRSKNGGATSSRLLPGALLAALLLTGAGSASYAQGTVIGGQDNTASGEYSVTTAGEGNKATGSHSAVTGGSYNTASGRYSTVIGGGDLPNGGGYWWNKNANEAKADWSTILGGYGNTIEKDFRVYSSRFDGGSIKINADNSTIVGGHNNRDIGGDSFIAGGNGNTAYGYGSSVYGGSYNFASNYSMIVGGIGNLTGAPHSYSLFGYFNQVANYQALAIGGQYERVIGEYSIGIGGGSTGREAENATAIGNHSVVTTKNGLALGYQATTNAEGTISFGHEKGDVSGYDSKLKPDVDGYSPNDFENSAVDLDSGQDNTGKVYTPTTYNEAYYNRLVKVADGRDNHDAVVVEQLKTLAAASDASNIGTNLTKVPVKDADGNIQYEESGAMKLRDATNEEKIANAESWGDAIGTGKVEKDDKKLVTGGTVFDALSKIKINSADTHIKDGTYGVDSNHQVSMAIVGKDGEATNETVTITDVAKASEVGDLNYVDGGAGAKGNVVTNGDSVTSAIGKLDQAVHNASSVANNITGSSNIDVTNIIDGKENVTGHMVALKNDISLNSVTAKTVRADEVNTKKLDVTDSAVIGKVTINQDGNGTANGLTNTTWDASNITSGQAATEDQLKAATKNGISYDGDDSKTITLRKDTTIENVADTSIAKGSKNAVNAGTVYNETRVAKDGHYIKASNTAGANITALDNQVAANAGNIFNLDNRVGELGSRINKVGAGAAALAALHPLDFDPSDKWDFAAGVGNYRNETAAAVGIFYRPNARSMFNLGWTMGDNRNMVNGGFSIKLGRGSVYNDMSKAQMAETIATQSKEISAMKADNAAIRADYDALKADNEAKEKRIDALEKQMQEIMARLGK